MAAASREPAFVLNGVRSLAIEGDRAVFILDAYITDNGVRAGSEAEVEDAPPLHAVREGGRWRLIPDRLFLTLRDLSLGVRSRLAARRPQGGGAGSVRTMAKVRRILWCGAVCPGGLAVKLEVLPTVRKQYGPAPHPHRRPRDELVLRLATTASRNAPGAFGLTGNWVRFVTPLSLPAPRIAWACMQRGSVGAPIPRAHEFLGRKEFPEQGVPRIAGRSRGSLQRVQGAVAAAERFSRVALHSESTAPAITVPSKTASAAASGSLRLSRSRSSARSAR